MKRVARISPLVLLIFAGLVLATQPGDQKYRQSLPALRHAQRNDARSIMEMSQCEPFESQGFQRMFPLTSSTIDSIGRTFSQHNIHIIKEADSLLHTGAFGPPQSRDAQRDCLLYFQLRAWNGIQSVVALAQRSDGIFAGEGDSILIPFRRDYMNAAVYPLQFLKRMWLGGNRFCVEYDAPIGYESRVAIGDERVRFRTFQTNLPEKGRCLVLSRELLIADGKQIELLYEEIVHGRVSWDRIVDRGDSLDVLAIYDLAGMYARKAGIHAIGAIVMWKNIVQHAKIPRNPRVGAIAYLPNLKLRLPFLLPDLGFDDRRDFGYPMPLMRAEFFRPPTNSFPNWVETTEAGAVYHWHGIGPRPDEIDERFPDF